MTNHEISKQLLNFNQAKGALLFLAIFNALTIIYLFIYGSAVSAFIALVGAVILFLSYANAKKGRSGGFYWGLVLYVINALVIIINVIMIDASFIGGIFVAVLIVVVFAQGIKAKKMIPENIDIVKTLDEYKKDLKQRKKDKTFSGKAYRQSIKDGTFEMALYEKESFSFEV